MGNSNSSSSTVREEDDDIDFDETAVTVPAPLDPNVESFDPDININVAGATAISVTNVKSEYSEIKKEILLRSKNSRKTYVYQDDVFPADRKSLCYSRPPPRWDSIVWKRPHEIARNPKLIIDGISSEDVIQGELGDCWFLASCAAVSRTPKFVKKIIPSNQFMTGPEYVGMFHFRFWRFGSWVDVIVDDCLPTMSGYLCFARSKNRNEFWLPLVEKAYAKLHESYQAIEEGFSQDGLEDLTGGIAVIYTLGKKARDNLFRILHKALKNLSFVCAGIAGSGNIQDKGTGLVSAHAYALLRAVRVKYKGETVELLKIRNPWGGKVEWKGDWSDRSDTWEAVDQNIKDFLDYADLDNGEWWMSFQDFRHYFENVTICTIGPDFDQDGAPTGDNWLVSTANGEWIAGISAGGSRNNVHSYANNPQYFLELKEPDNFNPEEDDPLQKGMCSVVIGLMQEYRHVGRSNGMKNLYIALNIFQVNEKPSQKRNARFFQRHREVAGSGTYVNRREVTITAELPPGNYVIVPSTFNAEKKGSFLLRIFTEKKVDLKEL